nr:serine protease [Ancylobacter gelatini]
MLLSCPASAASPLERVYEDARRHPIPAAATVVGSGFFIGPTTVLTSAHVLAGCASFGVENKHMGWLPAQRGRIIADRDAALLTVSVPSDAVLSIASDATAGDFSILGFPATARGDTEPVRVRAERVEMTDDLVLLLTGNVPAGFSGGPVIDGKGRAAAILTGRMNSARQELAASPISVFRGGLDIREDQPPSAPAQMVAPSLATVKVRCK